jgi:mannose-6-phosphate isomerase-like protein (cupin superfamily)
VGHDNYGRAESHLLFYSPAPVAEELAAVRSSAATFPPFPTWKPGRINEAVTQCMGTPGHDIAIFPADEQLLLAHVNDTKERIEVLMPKAEAGVSWCYRSNAFRLGIFELPASGGGTYRRNLDADEVQYQISGRRLLVTQHGQVELEPGDFVRIPLGAAYTSIAAAGARHLSVLSNRDLPQVAATSRISSPYDSAAMAEARAAVERGEQL